MSFGQRWENLYARRARILPATPDEPDLEENIIDFTFGHPDPSLFPVESIEAASATVLGTLGDIALQYADFRGSEALLEMLASHFRTRFQMELSSKNLIVTSGSMQVLGLMAQVFLDPGDIVLTEAPTYFRAVTIFRNYDAQVQDVPIDQDGLRVDLLEETLRRQSQIGEMPKFLYTIPTHQNPSGTTLSLDRRHQILDLSSRYGFVILEDTAYNELWYDEEPPRSLFELDANADRVIQMGTFSKTIAPGLSVGWALGPEPVTTRFVEFKVNGGTTPLTSLIAATFFSDEHFDKHVNSLRLRYRQKRDAAVEALEKHMGDFATWYKPSGGYFIWLKLSEDIHLPLLRKLAFSEGVIYLPGEFCYAKPQVTSSMIRLSFSCLEPSEIELGVRRLSSAARRSRKT